MHIEFINKIRYIAEYRNARNQFVISDIVEVNCGRKDDEWDEIIANVRSFCRKKCNYKYEIFTPLSADIIIVNFQDANDAILFRTFVE